MALASYQGAMAMGSASAGLVDPGGLCNIELQSTSQLTVRESSRLACSKSGSVSTCGPTLQSVHRGHGHTRIGMFGTEPKFVCCRFCLICIMPPAIAVAMLQLSPRPPRSIEACNHCHEEAVVHTQTLSLIQLALAVPRKNDHTTRSYTR